MSAKNNPIPHIVKILIVEDSATQAKQLRHLLEQNLYTVTLASDGKQALSLLSESQPALIISDIVMPEMNGYELCQRIKADEGSRDIPVILLTSLSNPEDVLEGLACGADSFITKPYSADYLLAHIQQLLANWKLRNKDRVRIGVEILFAGKRRFISADQQQMLGLLLSSYDAAVQRNTELVQTQEELRALNEHLEDLVEERTAALSMEVAEHKQAEENLRKLERENRLLADNSPDLIARFDTNLKHVYVNPAAAQTGKLSASEYIGLTIAESGVPESVASVWEQRIRQVLSTNKMMEVVDTFPTPEGLRYFNTKFVPELAPDGSVGSILSVARDITEIKQAEVQIRELNATLERRVEARTRELREAQEQLVRQEKLAVLGQLAGGVGHELRNPLGVINNAIYYLRLVQPEADEKVREYLGMIETETHSADKIISDLLDFSRIKSVDVEPMFVSELVRGVLERFPAPENVQVTLNLPENLPAIYVDPRQMTQVLGNLALNACQAMVTPGSTTGVPIGGKLTLSAAKKGKMVAIAVTDTGAGILPENIHKIFEPLFTTKAKGIGLGLAVSQKLVEANGGRIEVESEMGKGSTFTVYLPIFTTPN